MTDWKPEKTAPKDGSAVLLWARLRAHPLEKDSFSYVVGFWHRPTDRWKVLGTEDDLYAHYWAPIPKPPGEEEGQ